MLHCWRLSRYTTTHTWKHGIDWIYCTNSIYLHVVPLWSLWVGVWPLLSTWNRESVKLCSKQHYYLQSIPPWQSTWIFIGQENDIIILSTVRSNSKGRLGFISTENRICVSLSRAKYGLYVIGNLKMMSDKSGECLWLQWEVICW